MVKFVIALTASVLVSFGAMAQSSCGPYDQLQDYLARNGEQVRYIGLFGEAGVMELWLNPDTGSFTMVGRPHEKPEIGCVIGGGQKWREATTPKHIPGKDS